MSTLVWAHRGASAYAPENTLPAFQLAADMHADGIELDTHLTRDGQLAVSHDGHIERCSNGTGNIADMTMAELRAFDFGNAPVFGDKFKGTKIPTLGEVYALLKPTPLTINVELKASGDEYLRLTAECEREYGMKGRIIYSSFNHFNLVKMLELDPTAFVAPLYGDGIVKPWCYAKSFGAKALHPNLSAVYNIPDYVRLSHEEGIRVHPWTVDDEANIKRLLDLGVDAIITNKPDVAISIRG